MKDCCFALGRLALIDVTVLSKIPAPAKVFMLAMANLRAFFVGCTVEPARLGACLGNEIASQIRWDLSRPLLGRSTIGDTFATQWVATADFLLEPYRGSDAYITKDGLMQSMVTTFDGGALRMKK